MERPSKIYTTKELAELTAGGDSYIRTKGGLVKGLAITNHLLPQPPRLLCQPPQPPQPQRL